MFAYKPPIPSPAVILEHASIQGFFGERDLPVDLAWNNESWTLSFDRVTDVGAAGMCPASTSTATAY
ncbi:MAG: hypothetical protein ACR2O4_13880 [Hyphomicrobiaceae bacterium]